MSANTKIEWCDHTFNPWEGCQKVGPGCDHCYAENRNTRFGGGTAINWGPGAPRRRTSPANWALPVKWNKQAEVMQSAWAHGVALHGGDEASCIAAGFIKPQRPKVFCASLADVFDNAVDPTWRYDLFNLILSTPNLDWLLLTKRIGNAAKIIADTLPASMKALPPDSPVAWPWPHVWIGATIVNQEEADRDIPKLFAVPAAKRFLSMEPLLGPVNLRHLNEGREFNEVDCLKPDNWDEEVERWRDTSDGWEDQFEDYYEQHPSGLTGPMHAGIDWVIVGGESGPGARPMHPEWARSLRDQCQAAGVPYLFKQWGEWMPTIKDGDTVKLVFPAGAPHGPDQPAFHDWADGVGVARVGKKAAGRLLDGITHDGVPS